MKEEIVARRGEGLLCGVGELGGERWWWLRLRNDLELPQIWTRAGFVYVRCDLTDLRSTHRRN